MHAARVGMVFGPGILEPEDRLQHFEVRLMGELAKACADPDMGFFPVWAKGVWVGSTDRPLQRSPAVFE